MKLKTRQDFRARRHLRIRKKISGSAACPRLAIMVSNKYINAQLIDDDSATTIAGVSSRSAGVSKTVESAKQLGLRIGEMAKEKGIARFVVDRGGFAYHGRVKALVEGALESGLTNTKEKK